MHVASTVDQLADLGRELNTHQHQAVHLAARYDDELDWYHQGFKSPSAAISDRLQLHTSTAREWIRVGHALRDLTHIDTAFANNEISYAKVRILTRWAEPHNQTELLALARTRTASRLTTAIAQAMAADGETDIQRDQRHHDARSLTSYTNGDGMIVIRIELPPTTAKPILAAVDSLVERIARTPAGPTGGSRAIDNTTEGCSVAHAAIEGDDASADAFARRSVTETPTATTRRGDTRHHGGSSLRETPFHAALHQLESRWHPHNADDQPIPTLAQQRADAFTTLVLGPKVELTTEVVIHVRGDGNTFDDGTPLTTSAVCRHLDHAFIRVLVHDAERRPVNASSRRRHPTTRQKRVVMETHNHECVDCSSTDLIEFDHNPPYHRTHHTITTELEPRCAPCHRARHRHAA